MIARPCNNCQVEYLAEPRYLNRGQGIYCSTKCSGEANAKRLAEKRSQARTPNTKCNWCNKPIYRSQKQQRASKNGVFFCSRQHQSLSYAAGVVKTGPQSKSRPVCPGCNKTHRGKGERCQSCYKAYVIEQWLNGNNDITLERSRTTGLPVNTKRFVKKYLLETRGDRCEVCGFDEKAPDGRSIIQMDHINGNCFDNRPENLRLLCPNHHAMTPNYGSLNRGSGRAHRRKSN